VNDRTIEAIIGPISTGELFVGLGMQMAWVVAMALLLQFIWRRGIYRYGAVGG
jgi:ABC-2 type transport system permease protein